jgi:hypothetical protein
MNDRLGYQVALALAIFDIALLSYAYYLHPARWVLILIGLFLSLAVHSVSKLRKLGVRA